MDGLERQGLFQARYHHEKLRAEGLIPEHKTVGMRMLYDAKTRDGLFDKAKKEDA